MTFAVLLLYLFACFSSLYDRYERFDDTAQLIGPIILMILGFAALMAVIAAVSLLLSDFVVPIMYRRRISAARAWGVFLPLVSQYPVQFIGYGLLILLMIIILVIAIVIGGLITCCIGFLILAIPYVNEVLLLAVTYTLRAFSVEFLEQFGAEFQIFPRPASAQTTEGPQPA